jgi:hypothetical protein
MNAEFFLATSTPGTHNATLNGFLVGHRISPEMSLLATPLGPWICRPVSPPDGGNARKMALHPQRHQLYNRLGELKSLGNRKNRVSLLRKFHFFVGNW